MRIGPLDLEKKVMIVAEIGNNHEGDLERAKDMIHAAARSGVDAVKFQTFRTEDFIARSDTQRFKRLKSFELPFEGFVELAAEARKAGVIFLSTPLDLASARFLDPLVPAFKIASSDNNFYPLLETVAKMNKPLMVSTGFADLALLRSTVGFLKAIWKKENTDPGLVLLHCVSHYPASADELNLRAIHLFKNEFHCLAGFSDHSIGIEAALLAVALGARVLEKHFTLDKNLSDFRDHKISVDPGELTLLVWSVRQAELMLGLEQKTVQPSEAAVLPDIRRYIIATRSLSAGHRLTPDDISWVRCRGDYPAGNEKEVLGRVLKKNTAEGEPLRREHF